MRIEKKMFAQVRFYETLHVVIDDTGERIYTGTEEMAKKVRRVLMAARAKPKLKRKRK